MQLSIIEIYKKNWVVTRGFNCDEVFDPETSQFIGCYSPLSQVDRNFCFNNYHDAMEAVERLDNASMNKDMEAVERFDKEPIIV